MNFSFWPFLWFGLPGRLPKQFGRDSVRDKLELSLAQMGPLLGHELGPVPGTHPLFAVEVLQ